MWVPARICILAPHSRADGQAVPAAAQGHRHVKRESLRLRAHTRPGSSCLQRRWWLHAKCPWPLCRGTIIITIPHVPSGERLSSWNMWHFTDTGSGIVTTRRWGVKVQQSLPHALWAHGRGGWRMRTDGEGGGCRSSFHRWEPVQRVPVTHPPPLSQREHIQMSFWSGLSWGLLLAWAGFRWSWPGLMRTSAVPRSRLCLWMGKCPPSGNYEMEKEGDKTTQTQSAHKLTGQVCLRFKTQSLEPDTTRMSYNSPAQGIMMLRSLLCTGGCRPSIPWLGHAPCSQRNLVTVG